LNFIKEALKFYRLKGNGRRVLEKLTYLRIFMYKKQEKCEKKI